MRSKLSKSLAVLLAAVLLVVGIGVMPESKAAASEKPRFTIKTNASSQVKAGDTIDVELWLESGSDLEYFVLNFQYDTNIYDTVEKSNKKGDLLKELSMGMVDFEEGNISIVADLSECEELDLEPYGQLYKVKLKVKDDAEGTGNLGVQFIGGNNTDNSQVGAEQIDVVAEDKDGNVIKDGKLPIFIELQSITLNKTEPFTMVRGTEDDLSVTAKPASALTGKKIQWTSSNEKAVTVSKEGHIKAAGIGEAVITANVEGKTASVKVTVHAPLTSISLNKSTLALRKGASETLTVSYNPADTTDKKDVTWTSKDTSVAVVDKNGKVTALKDGETTITAKVGDKTAECKLTVKEEPLTGISLNQTTLNVARGTESQALQVIYLPEDTTDDKTVTWTSKDSSIASVKDGVVTGKGIGSTIITAKVGKFSASCEVTVDAPLQSIALSKEKTEVLKNKSQEIQVSLNPEDTTDAQDVTWSLSNSDVAEMTVAANEKSVVVKGLKQGETVVTVTSVARPELTASCKVTVKEIPLEGITMSQDYAAMEEGETLPLSVTYNTEDTTDEKTVTWKSTNPAVASVDANGLVTALSGGTAKIIATAANGVKAECEIKVLIHTTGITVTPSRVELLKGEKTSAPLNVTFAPENTDDKKDVTWKSSDETVAKVDANGYVTGIKEGTAVVTAETTDGKHSAVCEVTVTEMHLENISFGKDTPSEMLKGEKHVLEVVRNPENTTDEVKMTYTSSDENVAVADANGVVTALKAGTTVITATAEVGDKSWTISYELTVTEIPLKGISFKEKVETLEEGQKAQLELLFDPENTTDDKIIVWNSSNEDVATVVNGLVTAKKAGKTTISVKVGTIEISYELTVTKKQAQGTEGNGSQGAGTNHSGGSQNTGKNPNKVPQTGDTNPVMMIMILSCAVLSVIMAARSRRLHR